MGAAILFLVTWVVFSVAGAETSSLKDTVAVEAFVGLVTMVPFITSANVREHTNWVILASFLPCQAASVPLGALALQRVSPAYLELTFSALIALFVSERTGAIGYVARKCGGGKSAVAASTTAGDDGDGDARVLNAPDEETGEEVEARANWWKEPKKFLMLPVDNDGLTFNGENWKFMLCWAGAGCMSGFLGGMTGTHGPPAIACYTMMKVSKDIVRATSAAILVTVMCSRLVTYAVNGMFDISKPGVYGAAGGCGLAGVCLGIYAQKFINKDQFTKILLGILGLGSVLMLYKGIEDL